MARDPLDDLSPEVRRYIDQIIEARSDFVRSQADKEGYERAKAEFALVVPGQREPSSSTVRQARKTGRAKRHRKRSTQSAAARDRKLIEDAFRSVAPGSELGPSDIKKAVEERTGIVLAFTPLRRAVEALEGDRVLLRIGDQKVWTLA